MVAFPASSHPSHEPRGIAVIRPSAIAFRTAASLVLGLALGAGLWACARAGEKPRTKILMVGIDAGEWDVLGPLLDQKKVPSFARLRDEGAAGKLRSLEPLTKSPIIWASIATGKVPSKHGVLDFMAKRIHDANAKPGEIKESPTTSNLWRARPIWEILGSLGKKVGVVGWWTTWPAQPVNGFLVSDYAQYDSGSWPGRDTRRTYPESLDSLAKALRRSPESVSWAEIFQFVPPIDTTHVTQRQEDLVRDLKWIYAADMTFYRIGLHLYRENHPEFFAVYFRGVDAVSHRYWDLDVPGEFSPPLTDDEYRWLKNLIPNYYVFTDRMIGEYLKEADAGTNVVVCSDHGFMGGGRGVMAHKLDGMVFLMGPGVKRGSNITGATVLDITPTILALFGLPTAQDMDGRPIEDALAPSVVRKIAHDTRLKTYEPAGGRRGDDQPIASPVDQELRDRLKSLGYIQ
jgi:predicted AlkP superfamily phosphohydrolase/phosphomutase